MPSKNLKDKYLPIISSKWVNNESYDSLMSVIWQYVDEVLESKDLNPNKNPHFGLKLANDFEKEVYDYLYLVKKGNWTRRRAADDNYKLYWLEYEVQFLAFYEVRKRLYNLLDLWITEEFENKKVIKKDGLAGLAQDGQNVHTQAVVNQTNDGITIIRKTVIPKGQNTLDEIINAWITTIPESIELLSPVFDDMQKFNTINVLNFENGSGTGVRFSKLLSKSSANKSLFLSVSRFLPPIQSIQMHNHTLFKHVE